MWKSLALNRYWCYLDNKGELIVKPTAAGKDTVTPYGIAVHASTVEEAEEIAKMKLIKTKENKII